MDEEQYLTTVREQRQAYGYEPVDAPAELSAESLYIKREKKTGSYYFVSIVKLDDEGVAPIREATKNLRQVVTTPTERTGAWPGVANIDNRSSFCCLPLLLPPSITAQMEIYIEEGHDIFGGDRWYAADGTTFPVLVDVENDRLVYRESTGIKKWAYQNSFGKIVEKIFQV